MTRADQSSESCIRDCQLPIFNAKKIGSIKSFSGRSLQTWSQCSHPAQTHKTLQITLSVNSQYLPICQLKPEVLNSSKILSSGSWNYCWGSETHCMYFRWEYRKVKKCFICNKEQFFFLYCTKKHLNAPLCLECTTEEYKTMYMV